MMGSRKGDKIPFLFSFISFLHLNFRDFFPRSKHLGFDSFFDQKNHIPPLVVLRIFGTIFFQIFKKLKSVRGLTGQPVEPARLGLPDRLTLVLSTLLPSA